MRSFRIDYFVIYTDENKIIEVIFYICVILYPALGYKRNVVFIH
jgi:hypothetical protein